MLKGSLSTIHNNISEVEYLAQLNTILLLFQFIVLKKLEDQGKVIKYLSAEIKGVGGFSESIFLR